MTSGLRCVNLVHPQQGFSESTSAVCCSPQTRQNDLPRPCYTQPKKAERQEIASGDKEHPRPEAIETGQFTTTKSY